MNKPEMMTPHLHICRILVLAGISALCLTSCTSNSSSSFNHHTNVKEIASNYSTYQKITDHPLDIDPYISYRCSPVDIEEVAKAREKHGPHANASILVYMNNLAAQNFTNRIQSYPVGSVIVKEKQLHSYVNIQGKEIRTETNGIGGMIKRTPGYDPNHGDWEYFYFEKPTRIKSGRITSCVKCHAYAHKTDYVYGAWQLKEKQTDP